MPHDPRPLSLVGLAVLTALAAALPGCSKPVPDADLTFASGTAHHSLDPQAISWLNDGRIINQLDEPLVRLDFAGDFAPQPAAAASWEVSQDKTIYTFHIREDARWSNGDALTAHDFITAWRRAMLPDQAAQYAQLFEVIKGAKAMFQWRRDKLAQFAKITQNAEASSGSPAPSGSQGQTLDAAQSMWQLTLDHFDKTVGLAAPDDKTLVVTLARPTPYFLDLAAFVTFVPNHTASLKKASSLDPDTGMRRIDATYWSDPGRLVTNGPYQLAGRQFKRYLHMTANPYYWNRRAMKNHSVLERIIDNQQVAMENYQRGRIDWLPDIPSAKPIAAQLARQNRPDVHTQPIAGVYFYNFNCQPELPDGSKNPLHDPRVRRALAMAIDREKIVSKITRMNQPIAKTFVPPGVMPSYQPPADAGVSFDPGAAKKLLAQAGYAGGKGLTGLSILYNTGQGHEGIAQAVAAMWRTHLGVHVELQGLEGKTFGQRLEDHRFTIARASWIGDYPDPTTFLDKMTTTNGNNDCAWSNPAYDALIHQAQQTAAPAARRAILQKAESLILEDQPMALLFQYRYVMLWDPAKVRNLKPNPWARWRMWNIAVNEKNRK